MQNINHGKYINYLILQSNSEIDVLYERERNSRFPADQRQKMIKKKDCCTPVHLFDINLYSFANNLFPFSTLGPFYQF